MLVFYPRNTYNIDDMARYNKYSWVTGFHIHLFSKIDESTIRELVDVINEFKPKIFLVFPSPLNMIADTIRKKNLPLKHHPQLINTSGETFFDCQRKNVAEVFTGSTVEDSYGSVELGEISHETKDGLEIFANVAYVETAPNEQGKPEMIITRLDLSDFPFIRYKMRDVATVEFIRSEDGTERFVITRIEGKDSNYILSDTGNKFYPSFFNEFVNDLNDQFDDHIVEVKVYERGQKEIEVQFIVKDDSFNDSIRVTTEQMLNQRISNSMSFDINFVDFIDHDYRRKYRVIERIGDVEYAGGIVGDQEKLDKIAKDSKDRGPQPQREANPS
jgi:phenylacetate-coenzyme A ligase PaaK-like adenylate-forming protein